MLPVSASEVYSQPVAFNQLPIVRRGNRAAIYPCHWKRVGLNSSRILKVVSGKMRTPLNVTLEWSTIRVQAVGDIGGPAAVYHEQEAHRHRQDCYAMPIELIMSDIN